MMCRLAFWVVIRALPSDKNICHRVSTPPPPPAFSSPLIKEDLPGRAIAGVYFDNRFFRHQACYSLLTARPGYMSCQPNVYVCWSMVQYVSELVNEWVSVCRWEECVWSRPLTTRRSVRSRVGNFRQKNYSAEDGIDGTIGLFRRNSGCSAEQKTLGIPLRIIPQRRKNKEFCTVEQK